MQCLLEMEIGLMTAKYGRKIMLISNKVDGGVTADDDDKLD